MQVNECRQYTIFISHAAAFRNASDAWLSQKTWFMVAISVNHSLIVLLFQISYCFGGAKEK